jgi:hypothetical protein
MGVEVGPATAPLILFGGAAGVGVATTIDFIFRPGLGVGVGVLCKPPTTRKLTTTNKVKKFRFITRCLRCFSPVANGTAAESFKKPSEMS